MKILLWNVLRDTSPDEIIGKLDQIEKQHGTIDMWCLCEVIDGLRHKLDTRGYDTFFQSRGDTLGGLLIASRSKLKPIKTIQLSKKNYSQGLHTSDLLLTKIESKVPITLAFTHLTYNRPSRWQQRWQEQKKLVSVLPRQNCILMGDLNTYPLELPLPSIISKLKRVGFNSPTWHSLAKRPIGFAHMQLDHVMATNDIFGDVYAQVLDFHLPSDHSPIVIHVN